MHSWLTNLIASNLSFSYGKELILKDISLGLQPGSLNALVGTNEAGKSTLLCLLQGQVLPDQVKILFNEIPLTKNRQQVELMPQRISINWNFPINIEDLVGLGHLKGTNKPCCEIEASLQRVGLSAAMVRSAGYGVLFSFIGFCLSIPLNLSPGPLIGVLCFFSLALPRGNLN